MGHLLQGGSSSIITQELRETGSAPKWKRILIPPRKGYVDEGRKGGDAVSSASLWLGEQLHSFYYLTLQLGLLF